MKVPKSVKALKVANFSVGDIVIKRGKIMSLTTKDSKEFGKKFFMTIKEGDKMQAIFVNQTSLDTLVEAFGDESEDWIGHKISVSVGKTEKNQAMFVVNPIKDADE